MEPEPQGAVKFSQRYKFALPIDVKIRKLLLQIGDLWKIVDHNVGIFGMMNGVIPVSYTHLDVYKRQKQTKAAPAK